MKIIERFRKQIVLLTVIMAAFLLSACSGGGTLNTTLDLYSDGSGARHMDYVVNIANNTQYVHGDADSITALAQSECPEELSFSAENNGTDVIYHFDLEFNSQEEYLEKVQALISEDSYTDPQISFIHPDSVFAKGFSYSENFTSAELMQWFSDLMVNSGYVDSGNQGYIFGNNNMAYNFDGEPVEGGYGSVSTLEFLPINEIDFYTQINDDDSFDRAIEVHLPQATMDTAGEEITAFLEGKASGAESSWTSAGGEQVFRIEAKNISAASVDALTKNFCANADLKAFTVEDGDPAAEEGKAGTETESSADSGDKDNKEGDPYLLFEKKHITEELDLQDYLANEYGEVNFHYYLNCRAQPEGTYTSGGSTRNLSFSGFEPGVYEELFHTYDYQIAADYSLMAAYTVTSADIDVYFKNGRIRREVAIQYADILTDDEVASLKEKAEEATADTAMTVKELKKNDGGFLIRLETEAPAELEDNAWDEVFDVSGYTSYYVSTKNKLALSKKIVFEDNFKLSPFTAQPIGEVNYKVHGIGSVDKKQTENLYGTVKGGNYEANYTEFDPESAVRVFLIGKCTNFLPLIFLLLAGLGIAYTVFSLVMAMKKSPASVKKTRVHTAAQTQTAAPQNDQSAAGQAGQQIPPAANASSTIYCPNCGTPVRAGNKFCPNCGNKLA